MKKWNLKMEFLWYYDDRNDIKDSNNFYRMHWLQKLKFLLISKKVSEKIAYICIYICKSSHNGRTAKIFEV